MRLRLLCITLFSKQQHHLLLQIPPPKHTHTHTLTPTMASDLKSKFLHVYQTLKSELLNDPAFEFHHDSRQWIDKMLDYNVPGGKLNRGLSVVDSYQLLKGGELTDDEIFLASALGWCIEWLQAYFLVLDDIMDGSHTRRGQPCWFRLPKVGLIAANDGLILRNHVPRILKKHFRGKPYYVDLVDLFNEVEFQTASGQMIDLITTLVGEKDLSKYSLSIHRRIVQYKTAYYSFYLPVACALLMFGEDLDNHVEVKNVLVEMGTYFQVQDDYLDCFGAPEVIGKIGTDIEDFKCSWLVVKALELANEEQKKVLHENYGKKDPSSVAKVKELYNTLNLQGVFEDYESTSYKKLITSIEGHPSKAVQAVLKSFLGKIYKRQKFFWFQFDFKFLNLRDRYSSVNPQNPLGFLYFSTHPTVFRKGLL
ncbi:putative transferase [Helianthus debilis subsp. tardiflorus]